MLFRSAVPTNPLPWFCDPSDEEEDDDDVWIESSSSFLILSAIAALAEETRSAFSSMLSKMGFPNTDLELDKEDNFLGRSNPQYRPLKLSWALHEKCGGIGIGYPVPNPTRAKCFCHQSIRPLDEDLSDTLSDSSFCFFDVDFLLISFEDGLFVPIKVCSCSCVWAMN